MSITSVKRGTKFGAYSRGNCLNCGDTSENINCIDIRPHDGKNGYQKRVVV